MRCRVPWCEMDWLRKDSLAERVEEFELLEGASCAFSRLALGWSLAVVVGRANSKS